MKERDMVVDVLGTYYHVAEKSQMRKFRLHLSSWFGIVLKKEEELLVMQVVR